MSKRNTLVSRENFYISMGDPVDRFTVILSKPCYAVLDVNTACSLPNHTWSVLRGVRWNLNLSAGPSYLDSLGP